MADAVDDSNGDKNGGSTTPGTAGMAGVDAKAAAAILHLKTKARQSRGAHEAFASGNDAENFNNLLGHDVSEQKEDKDHDPRLVSKLVAEAVGTFFLVFTVGVSTQ